MEPSERSYALIGLLRWPFFLESVPRLGAFIFTSHGPLNAHKNFEKVRAPMIFFWGLDSARCTITVFLLGLGSRRLACSFSYVAGAYMYTNSSNMSGSPGVFWSPQRSYCTIAGVFRRAHFPGLRALSFTSFKPLNAHREFEKSMDSIARTPSHAATHVPNECHRGKGCRGLSTKHAKRGLRA